MEINEILKRINVIDNITNQLTFIDNDARLDFLLFHRSILTNFYRGFLLMKIVKGVNNKLIAFDTSFKQEMGNLVQLFRTPEMSNSYENALYRRFFIDVFSNFEFFMTSVCEAILSNKTKEELLEWKSKDILQKLKKYELGEAHSILYNTLKEKQFSSVPFNRRIKSLFAIVKSNYKGDYSADKKFLLFTQKLRNTIHSNFNYFGDDDEYYFGSAHYVFKYGNPIGWYDEKRSNLILKLDLAERIKDIWVHLINAIERTAPIKYVKPKINY